jgi:hypothetical protein
MQGMSENQPRLDTDALTTERGSLEESAARQLDRLMEEINILRLEGSLFCFDPREAKRRKGVLTFRELKEHPVKIEPQNYGQPSVLAYRVLQAIFQKMTEEGYPYPSAVSFSQREIARLIGRSAFGGNQSAQIYKAIMQLHKHLFTVLCTTKKELRGRRDRFTQLRKRYSLDAVRRLNNVPYNSMTLS